MVTCPESSRFNKPRDEEISSLSHSVVFLYFFVLIAEEGFLFSLCYSLDPRHDEDLREPLVRRQGPILWLPHVKSGLIGEDPDAGKD